jgi:dTDP-4-dehydrorhamnose reductase
MSIVLFGKNGQLGQALLAAGPADTKAFDRSYVDLTNPDHIRAVLTDTKPTIIINAAAYTAVDKAEEEASIADAINHLAVACMAEEALKHDAVFVTYSTDYVFDGKKDTPYSEDDIPAPLNIYGSTKYAGEQAVLASGCRHLVLRTSWLYSDTPGNFVGKILSAAKSNAELRVVSDQVGAPTHVRDLAKTTFKMLENPVTSGLYHCAASGSVSRADWAKQIIERAGLATKITPIETSETTSAAQRPLNSRLSSRKLADDYGMTMPEWNV